MAKKAWSDPLGPHVRIYHSLLNTPAWRVLGPSAVKLYIDMRMTLNGSNNGSIGASLSLMKHKGWKASATLAKALYELRALGFIAVTIEGGLRQGTRVPSLYRFTDVEVYEQPKTGVQAVKATHDYRRFESVRDAERELVAGLEKLQEAGRKKQQTKKKSPVQKLNPSSSESEPEAQNFQYRN
ncbi:hypothetical protein [Burkholderia thailandensis]|uniref:hypothetical protein n=1 Tax=Burkholderia thailandensis TaxID=57975 RepID=UPI000492242D|nr:hypothetical protein [Burkholderia thailandensis]AIP62272.1 hypothetical protein DR62_2145 [Burkholderia thailandensis]AOI52564.1 hypothetical protein WI24_12680 [Burkholderia thailandensis]